MKKHKHIIRSLLLLGLCSILFCSSPAQSVLPLTSYTTENGLSLNSVNDLLFDRQGFLWITTADGLQRFDGYRFQTFRHDPADHTSLPENSVSEVYEDRNSNLWITYRTGICIKPKGKNEFIDVSPQIPSKFFRFGKVCVHENDSTVWVAAYPDGIFSFNKQSLICRKIYSFQVTGFNELPYVMIRYRQQGDVAWLRKGKEKNGDLIRIDSTGIHQISNPAKKVVFYLVPVHPDSLVVISDKSYYIAGTNDPFKPLRVLGRVPNSDCFNFEHLNQVRKIKGNQFLLAGIDQLFIYDGNRDSMYEFPYSASFPKDLARLMAAVTTDKHQNDWIGYNGRGGIKVFSRKKFNSFNRPLKDLLPYCITGDQYGNIYTGIYLGDIEMYDRKGQFLKRFALPATHKNTGSPRAMCMIDSVTLITRSTLNELYAIDTRSGNMKLLSALLPKRSDSVLRDFETDMHHIADNEVWFTYSNSILSLRKQNGQYHCTPVCRLPVQEIPTSFLIEEAGKIWIATPTSLWVYEKNNVRKIPLPLTYFKHINRDVKGNIWLATTNGIVILHNEKVIKTIGTKEGLPNSFVYSVLFDEQQNAWSSTNRGIIKIIPPADTKNPYQVISYTAKEGLQGDEFNTKGYYKSHDGTMYFAGVNGINYFKPGILENKSSPSPIRLTQIEVNNLPYRPDLQPEFIHSISLSHLENNISLSFSCMDFTVPEKNMYKFWLKGFQKNWSLPQTNNTVQYILPPGEHELFVLGANYEGVWSSEPLVLKINILPPWYQTTWAKLGLAFLILSVVAVTFYFISKNRYNRKLRKIQMEQDLQQEKQRLSRDLHDNLGAQITWLSNSIQQVQQTQDQEKSTGQNLGRLKEGVSELMQTLRETIWILNKDKISGIDLFDKLVNHAAKYLEAYPSIQLQTEEKIAADIQLSSGHALQLFRICQEAITNACKHSGASKLSIIAGSNENKFTIQINDQGIGFNAGPEASSGHYGLQNMRERASESGLELTIESAVGKGTFVSVTSSKLK